MSIYSKTVSVLKQAVAWAGVLTFFFVAFGLTTWWIKVVIVSEMVLGEDPISSSSGGELLTIFMLAVCSVFFGAVYFKQVTSKKVFKNHHLGQFVFIAAAIVAATFSWMPNKQIVAAKDAYLLNTATGYASQEWMLIDEEDKNKLVTLKNFESQETIRIYFIFEDGQGLVSSPYKFSFRWEEGAANIFNKHGITDMSVPIKNLGDSIKASIKVPAMSNLLFGKDKQVIIDHLKCQFTAQFGEEIIEYLWLGITPVPERV